MKNILPLLLLLGIISCTQKGTEKPIAGNPAAPGFDSLNSDYAAIELADSIMSAMGGRQNWEQIQFIEWKIPGKRKLTWDKRADRVRIESFSDSTIYLLDLKSQTGKVKKGASEITDEKAKTAYLEQARDYWFRDSYEFLMPYKLKESGNTLKYLGEDTLQGTYYNILELTFRDSGKNAKSKIQVFVDMKDNLVKEWAYFENKELDSATFVRVWDNYQPFEGILLSSNRSDGSGPAEVKILKELNENVFNEF